MRWPEIVMSATPHGWHQPSDLPSPEELGKHAGEHVAVLDRKVVAHGKDMSRVHDRALTRSKGREPTMMYVPRADETHL
jgi:hypothetical protein